MHVGIANPAVAVKTFPAFPAHAQPAIFLIWQETHGNAPVLLARSETNPLLTGKSSWKGTSDVELQCFHFYQPKQVIEQKQSSSRWFERPHTHCNGYIYMCVCYVFWVRWRSLKCSSHVPWSPSIRRQTITWANGLSFGNYKTKFGEISIWIDAFIVEKSYNRRLLGKVGKLNKIVVKENTFWTFSNQQLLASHCTVQWLFWRYVYRYQWLSYCYILFMKISDEACIQIANSYGMFLISLVWDVIKHVNYNDSYKRLIDQMANTGQRSATAKLFGFNPCRVEYVLGTKQIYFRFHIMLRYRDDVSEWPQLFPVWNRVLPSTIKITDSAAVYGRFMPARNNHVTKISATNISNNKKKFAVSIADI